MEKNRIRFLKLPALFRLVKKADLSIIENAFKILKVSLRAANCYGVYFLWLAATNSEVLGERLHVEIGAFE